MMPNSWMTTEDVFILLIWMTINAAAVAAVVLTLCLLLGRWIAPRFRALLWMLVAVRLILPVAPSSAMSLQSLWKSWDVTEVSEARTIEMSRLTSTAYNPPMEWVPAAEVPVDTPSQSVEGMEWVPAAEAPSETPSLWVEIADGVSWTLTLLFLVWPIGMLLTAMWTILACWSLRKRLRDSALSDDSRLQALLEECRLQSGLWRTVQLRIVPELRSPAQMGLWRPTILLPDDVAQTFSDSELRHIFLHELAHVRRFDVAVNWLMTILQIVHWCNPLFWLVRSRLLAERELACDAAVLKIVGRGSASAYGGTLLRVLERMSASVEPMTAKPTAIPALLGVLRGKSALRNRLRALSVSLRGETRGKKTLAALLLLLTAVVGLTDAAPDEPAKTPTRIVLPRNITWQIERIQIPDAQDSTTTVQVYDVTAVLKRMMEETGSRRVAAENFLIQILGTFGLESASVNAGILPESNDDSSGGGQPSARRPRCVISGNQLIVCGPSEISDRVKNLLETWANQGLTQITLSVRMISSSSEVFPANGAGGQIFGPAGGAAADARTPLAQLTPVAFGDQQIAAEGRAVARSHRPVSMFLQTLSPAQVSQFLQKVQGNTRDNIVMAPKITLFNGHHATVADVARRPFVVGLRTNSQGGLDPQIQTISEGDEVGLRVTGDKDSAQIHLACLVRRTQVIDVATTTFKTLDGMDDDDVSLQVPDVEEIECSASAVLKVGESLLLAPLKRDQQGNLRFVLITPQIIEE